MTLDRPVTQRRWWHLDARVDYLNHGAFGACPVPVLAAQQKWQRRLERQPMDFLARELEPLWDEARAAVAAFVGAQPQDLVFVANATAGVNTVLRSLKWRAGDELLTTDHAYNACRNALNYVGASQRARVVCAQIPFPFKNEDDLVAPILSAVTPRTRLVLLDHITSPTAFILPVARLVRELERRGVDTLVDGAHAPGMVPLNLEKIGAAYYTGNGHKWLCGPKGAAFLHVRRDKQSAIRPLVISHGANSARQDRSRFLIEFGWMGTSDPSAWLALPEALRKMKSCMSGGWPEIMKRNHALAVAARRFLCEALEVEPPCPESFLGSMAAVALPDAPVNARPTAPLFIDPLQDALRWKHRIEVPVMPWPSVPHRWLRVSAQLYNSLPQYERLAHAAAGLLAGGAPARAGTHLGSMRNRRPAK